LLVRIHRLGTDEQLLADFGRRVSTGNEAQNVALALRELLEALALHGGGILPGEVLREHSSRGRPHVDVAVRHGAYGVHELPVSRALHEISRRTGLHQWNE